MLDATNFSLFAENGAYKLLVKQNIKSGRIPSFIETCFTCLLTNLEFLVL